MSRNKWAHATVVVALGVVAGGWAAMGTACTPAQGKILVTGVPADIALVTCVVETALTTGGDVLAVAGACGSDAAEVAKILYAAATLPKGARNAQVATANAIRSTPAFADAWSHYPQASP
jgi:membrane-associated protease RseP (regulator of RpoE activity)